MDKHPFTSVLGFKIWPHSLVSCNFSIYVSHFCFPPISHTSFAVTGPPPWFFMAPQTRNSRGRRLAGRGTSSRERERIDRTVERFIPPIVLFPDRHPAPAALHNLFVFGRQ